MICCGFLDDGEALNNRNYIVLEVGLLFPEQGDSSRPHRPPSRPPSINPRTTSVDADAEPNEPQQLATPYCYCPLLSGTDSIRLLRLLPSKDKNAPIRCQLFTYSLQESDKGTHPYDALSYVWGTPDESRSIRIDERDVLVTPNLYKALSHLRHCFIERILWADAVCINQEDVKEKEQQIQFMARIYGQANRVVVWLGEAAGDSDLALEEIRAAGGQKPTKSLDNKTNKQAVLALLQRPWFQRIWVLQEVAVARNVLVVCGPTEIDGYAFCLGIGSLKGFYEEHADLQRLIRSVTYLIRGAIFRPSYVVSGPGRVSQGIGSLGELIDMYHSHEATQRHDKVYALLGMSSDDLSKADLLPNYRVPWEQLLRRLTKYLLSKKISVETWSDKEIVIIKSKGFILGKVSSVQGDIDRDGRQGVGVILKNMSGKSGYLGEWSSHWTLQVSAKPIRIGDFICLLEGTSKPTIIRLCENYWTIILITATPPQIIRNGSKYIEWPKTWPVVELPTRDLWLLWDWENSPENSPSLVEHKGSQAHSEKLARLWSLALVLEDGEEYKKAEKKYREAMEGYERVFGEERLGTLKSEFDPALLSWAANLDVVGSQYSRTPLSWAAEGGHTTIVKLLLQTGEADANLKDMDGWAPLSRAAEGGHLAVVERLLQEKADVNAAAAAVRKGRTALQAAAEGGHLAVVERLLQEKAKVNAAAARYNGRTALQAAAGGGFFAVVERLLQEKADVNAARGGGMNGRTALGAAKEGGYLTIIKCLEDAGANIGRTNRRELY